MTLLIVISACTTSEPSDPTDVETTTSTAPSQATTTLQAPPEVDVGVDLESGVLRLAVVGEVSEEAWSGHFAYWDAINRDLAGVGGRFEVELVRVDSAPDARTVGALAVSMRAPGDDRLPGDLLVAAPARQTDEPGLTDLTAVDTAVSLSAGRRALVGGELELSGLPAYADEILVVDPAADCPPGIVEAPDVPAVELDELEAAESPNLYYLCTPVDGTLSAAAAVLNAAPGSTLAVPGSAWKPELAEQLSGTVVYVIGYVPGPGVEGAPAAEVMAAVLGPEQWAGDEIDGYLSALSMHAVLERALAADDLTRSGVVEAADSVQAISLGFGENQVAVGILDTSSQTGVRFLGWVPSSG